MARYCSRAVTPLLALALVGTPALVAAGPAAATHPVAPAATVVPAAAVLPSGAAAVLGVTGHAVAGHEVAVDGDHADEHGGHAVHASAELAGSTGRVTPATRHVLRSRGRTTAARPAAPVSKPRATAPTAAPAAPAPAGPAPATDAPVFAPRTPEAPAPAPAAPAPAAPAPAPAAPLTGPHTFLNVDRGAPTRWNPCQPVPWVFHEGAAPAGGLAVVQDALATVSEQTGITFRYEGTTAEVPSARYLSQSWGRFRPLLIGWSTPDQSDLLAGGSTSLVGMARILWTGSYDAKGANHTQIASGVVALNGQVRAGTRGPNSWYTYVLHELGHAVGLGHVDDPDELMRATIPGHLSTYGIGDRTGLAAVGSGAGCLPAIR